VVVYCFSISRNLSATRSFIRANANHFLPIPLMSMGHEGRAKASSRLTNNIGEIAVLRFRVFSFPEGRKYKGEVKPLQKWRGWGVLYSHDVKERFLVSVMGKPSKGVGSLSQGSFRWHLRVVRMALMTHGSHRQGSWRYLFYPHRNASHAP